MTTHPRIKHQGYIEKLMSAEQAAELVHNGAHIGMSGFTGAGYPKALPLALAKRIEQKHAAGDKFKISVWTGASTAPELDGALARADAIDIRLPYQSDPACRQSINEGNVDYIDIHLSHVAQYVWFGYLGKLDIAVVEVAGITEEGLLIPSSSIGNNRTWLDLADKVILEVNSWHDERLAGMHDVYYGVALPPNRKPVPIVKTGDRIGEKFLRCDLSKVIGVIETHEADRNSSFSKPDATSRAIAGHIVDYFNHEVKRGRLPPELLPLQSGVGNVANAVMEGLDQGPFTNMTAYTEVLQDSMLRLIRKGKLTHASATALSLSPEAYAEFLADLDFYREHILLRPQEISNHPEVIRRLGVIAMNGIIEADIYGNVNSTHIGGTAMMNGIGGSGDFARNAYVSIFMTPSTAKNGTLSCIVPMVTHVDHTEHDVQIIVTEHGLANLHGLSPRKRAQVVIENCSDPKFKPLLKDYFNEAMLRSAGKHTPHIMDEAFSYMRTHAEKNIKLASSKVA